MSDEKRVDEDWKKRAEEEKENLLASSRKTEEEGAKASSSAAGDVSSESGDGESPEGAEANPVDPRFQNLIYNLAAQAMMGLGQTEDPHSGQRRIDLDLARESIEVLGMLEKKTSGNLAQDEATLMAELLRQLRMSYAQMAQAQQQQASQPPPEASGQ